MSGLVDDYVEDYDYMNMKTGDLSNLLQAKPKHELLRSYIRDQINTGELKPGDLLPAEVQLAQTLNISRSTVRQAMAALEKSGQIFRVRGKGSFVQRVADTQPSSSIADFSLLIPETQEGLYKSLLHGFEAATAKIHCHATVCRTHNNVDKQGNLILQLLRKKVAGVAFVPTLTEATLSYQVLELQERGIPVVFCHRRVQEVRAPLLTIPFGEVGQVAGEAFLKQGHTRVAFVSSLRSEEVTLRYQTNLRQTMQTGGGDLPEEFICNNITSHVAVAQQEEVVLKSLRQMFDNPEPPSAIFTNCDAMAELVYLLLAGMGLRVPDDVSVLGFGSTDREGAFLSRLASVVVDEANLGRQAVELLYQMSTGKCSLHDDKIVMMPLSLSDGQTLGPASKKKLLGTTDK